MRLLYVEDRFDGTSTGKRQGCDCWLYVGSQQGSFSCRNQRSHPQPARGGVAVVCAVILKLERTWDFRAHWSRNISAQKKAANGHSYPPDVIFTSGKAKLYHADCFTWLAECKPYSIHSVVTDPPYGLVEYTEKEQAKLRNGRGGVWRIPPSFDGHKRAPLPRFTVLDNDDLKELNMFFARLAAELVRVLVPGGNVVVASNPLLSHICGGSNGRKRIGAARLYRATDNDNARRGSSEKRTP